jgi:hypothetical protein
MRANAFFGGLPTAIDVRKLEETFGVPEPGTLIAHSAIAACIGVKWKSARYATVLTSWRKKLEDPHNLHTWVEPGEGLRILTEDEAVDARRTGWRHNLRAIKRTVIATSRIDAAKIVDPERRRVRDKLEQIASRVVMFAATESQGLKPPAPPSALPRAKAQ